MKKLFLILFFCSSCNLYSQWEKFSNGLFGTDISNFYFQDSTIYISSYTGGVYKSTDWGNNWIESNTGFKTLEVIGLAFLGNSIFAATEHNMHLSTDNGLLWNELADKNLHNISSVINFQNKIYAYNNTLGNGLSISCDTGKTWKSYKRRYDSHDIFDDNSVESFYIANNKLYAGTTSGIYVKGEIDTVWNRIETLTKYDFVYSIATKDNYMFTVCNYFPTVNGAAQISKPKIFFTSNSGISWNERGIELDTNFITSVVFSDSTLFAATNTGLFASSDLGKNWIKKNNFEHINKLAEKNGHIFLSTYYNNELLRSDDNGDTWTPCLNNLTSLSINFINKLNTSLIVSKYNGFYLQNDSLNSWEKSELDTFDIPITSIVKRNNEILIGTFLYGVYRSTDKGKSWSKFNTGFENLFVNKLINVEGKIFAATGDFQNKGMGVYFLNEGETQWKILKDSLYGNVTNDLMYIGSVLYAGTDRKGIFKSTNFGETWHSANNGIDDNRIRVPNLCSQKNFIFAYNHSDNIYVSSDKGKFWKKIDSFPDHLVSCMVSDNENLFVGTYRNGVFQSGDHGNSWKKISDGMNLEYIIALYIDENYLYCGTLGSSVWRYKFK